MKTLIILSTACLGILFTSQGYAQIANSFSAKAREDAIREIIPGFDQGWLAISRETMAQFAQESPPAPKLVRNPESERSRKPAEFEVQQAVRKLEMMRQVVLSFFEPNREEGEPYELRHKLSELSGNKGYLAQSQSRFLAAKGDFFAALLRAASLSPSSKKVREIIEWGRSTRWERVCPNALNGREGPEPIIANDEYTYLQQALPRSELDWAFAMLKIRQRQLAACMEVRKITYTSGQELRSEGHELFHHIDVWYGQRPAYLEMQGEFIGRRMNFLLALWRAANLSPSYGPVKRVAQWARDTKWVSLNGKSYKAIPIITKEEYEGLGLK